MGMFMGQQSRVGVFDLRKSPYYNINNNTPTKRIMEIWKPVLGYEGLYEVSDQGRVRNNKGHILKDRFKTPMRYKSVALTKNGKVKEKLVSSIVLESFVSPRPYKMVVRHLNGVAQDNRLDNLCWGTQSENILDKITHGTNNFNDVMVKLTHLKTGDVFVGRQRQLSRQLGINQSRIWVCCNRGGTTKGYKCEYVVTEEE